MPYLSFSDLCHLAQCPGSPSLLSQTGRFYSFHGRAIFCGVCVHIFAIPWSVDDACAAPRLGSCDQCCGDTGAAVCPSLPCRLLGGLLEPPQAVSVPHARSHVGEVVSAGFSPHQTRAPPTPGVYAERGAHTTCGLGGSTAGVREGSVGEDGRAGPGWSGKGFWKGRVLNWPPGVPFTSDRIRTRRCLQAVHTSPRPQRESRFQKKRDPEAG